MSRPRALAALVLALFGVAALVVAALLPTVVRDRAVGLPADLSQQTVTIGRADLLDAASFVTATPAQVLRDLPVRIASETTARDPISDSSMTVADVITGARTDITGPAATFFADNYRASVDRSTFRTDADPSPTWWTAPSTTPLPEPQRATTYLSFPPGTGKTAYQLYELRAHTPVTAEYVDDTREIDGMRTYHFRATLSAVDTTTTAPGDPRTALTLPGFKWGMPGGGADPVTLHQFYANTRDIWVEPTTGATLDTRATPYTYYARTADDAFKVDAFKADMRFDDATVRSLADQAHDGRTMIRAVFFWLPIGLAILGIALILVAAALVRRRPPTAPVPATTEAPAEPART